MIKKWGIIGLGVFGTEKATQHFLKTGTELVGVELGLELVAFLICFANASH